MPIGLVRKQEVSVLESKKTDKKLIIPRWRHWKIDLQGDIAKDSSIFAQPKNLPQIAEVKKRFQEECKEISPPPRVAARLANEALLFGDIVTAKKIAGRIHSSGKLLTPSRNFLRGLLTENESLKQAGYSREGYFSELRRIKKLLNSMPRNPLLWLERARLYTILSEKKKAELSVKVALTLAPSNRYIVRSSARFFMHFEEWDAAWYFSHKAFLLNPDPWLKSLTISVGSRDEVNAKLPSFRSRIVEARNHEELFSLSELNAAIGNLELTNGNEVKAKKLFRYSWKNPSSTVISHGVWLISNRLKGLSKSVHFDLSNNVQGSAYRLINERDHEGVIPLLNQWLLEEPYSSEPHELLFNAYVNLRRYDDAVRVAELGHASNPCEPGFLNQIAYALLRKDSKKDWEKAGGVLKKMEGDSGFMSLPVPIATKGMHKILTGEVAEGVGLYKQSLKLFAEKKRVEDSLVCAANLLTNLIRFNKGVPFQVYGDFLKKIAPKTSNYVTSSRLMLEHEAEKYKNNQLDDQSMSKCLEIDE